MPLAKSSAFVSRMGATHEIEIGGELMTPGAAVEQSTGTIARPALPPWKSRKFKQ